MLTRIVKMTFNPAYEAEFKALFKAVQSKIAASQGCAGVALHQDNANATVFFTISKWEDEAALNAYRSSALFTETWSKVKAHFSAKAEAWSLNSI